MSVAIAVIRRKCLKRLYIHAITPIHVIRRSCAHLHSLMTCFRMNNCSTQWRRKISCSICQYRISGQVSHVRIVVNGCISANCNVQSAINTEILNSKDKRVYNFNTSNHLQTFCFQEINCHFIRTDSKLQRIPEEFPQQFQQEFLPLFEKKDRF